MSNSLTKSKPMIEAGRYRHYKGNEYEVVDIVCHSETEEWMVLYRPCYGDKDLWVRPYNMFIESVELPSGDTVPRFDKV